MKNQYHGATEDVTCFTDDHIARVTINRPQRKNAVTGAMWDAISILFEGFSRDDNIRVALISGAGGDFCAGADISEFDSIRANSDTARDYEAKNSRAFAAIRNCDLPVIAAINGVCFGGGLGIAAACDIRIATADARFSVPAARLGLAYPQDAMIDIVDSAGSQAARYLAYTAARLTAAEARDCGFLLKVIDYNNFEEEVNVMLEAIAGNAPLSVRASKAAIDAVVHGGEARMEKAAQYGAITFDSADYAEGRAAFRERREPHFTGK